MHGVSLCLYQDASKKTFVKEILNLVKFPTIYINSVQVKGPSPHFFKMYFLVELATLAQMVASQPLVQQVRGSILGARRGGDVNFLMARLYITGLD